MKILYKIPNFTNIQKEILQTPLNWITHPYSNNSDAWSGISLRSADGKPETINDGKSYFNTSLLDELINTKDFLSTLQCDLARVRLLKLQPFSNISPHTDNLVFENHTEVRLQIPILSNQDVIYLIENEKFKVNEGFLYYLDVKKKHGVYNNGNEARISLVIDTIENDWVKNLISYE